ncbi:MAG: redox-sensing transcriptional repressor Rex [Planctomycetota bacterium]|jgi:redox-sensing transcriptional repressor|nr:redox-sensing transcriptional repressor Rex [Planctomycetota bacterium]
MRNPVKKAFPQPSIRRLPGYLRLLRQLRTEGGDRVSCTRIASELDLDSTQVRKDLALTGIAGKPRIGYNLEALIGAIEKFLSWDRITDAFLVGAGSLGRALIGYENFGNFGLRIVAAFDVAEERIGDSIHGRPVRHLREMPALAKEVGVAMGILTVPASAAQDAALVMVESGLLGIWNFTPVKLDLPASIAVENVELVSSLAVLSLDLARRREQAAAAQAGLAAVGGASLRSVPDGERFC